MVSKAFQPQNHASVLVINYFVVPLANPQTDIFCPPGTQITKLTLTALASYPYSQGPQKSSEGRAIACFPRQVMLQSRQIAKVCL